MNKSSKVRSPLSSPKKSSNKTSRKISPIKERGIPNFNEDENTQQEKRSKKTENSQADIQKLRLELQNFRTKLASIQNEEDTELQNYSSLEAAEQKRIFDIRDQCKKAPFPNLAKSEQFTLALQEIRGLYEEMVSVSDENKKLRQQVVSADNYIYQKINKQQIKASDAQSELNDNEVILSKIQNEYDSLLNENTSLKEATESINFELFNLNNQEKDLQLELDRIKAENRKQKEEYRSIKEKYEEMKGENEVLTGHREKEKQKMEKKLSVVVGKRDEFEQNVNDLMEKQQTVEKSIEENLKIYEDLMVNRNRLDSEIQHLTALSAQYKEQAENISMLLNS